MEEETGTVKMVMSKKKTVKMVKMGVMVAISVAMVYLVHFPIFPAVPFLEYDPADISILIGTFAFGPEAGLVLTVVTAVVQGLTVSAGSGLYGILQPFPPSIQKQPLPLSFFCCRSFQIRGQEHP